MTSPTGTSLDHKRSVSFDEELNEVREFDRIPPEDKANIWLSKVQIRENRIQVAEELMMEKTKELVKAKLIEETKLPTDPAELVLVVKKMQQDLDDIMSRSKPEILAFLQNKYNWITDCTDYWQDLPPPIQQAASQLGYTQELWDEFSQKLDVFEKPWNALTSQEQEAAKVLGYNEVTWNGSLDVDDGSLATMMLDEEPKSSVMVVEMEEGEDAAAEPEYDWTTANNDDSSSPSSDYDGDEEKMSDRDSHDEKSSGSSDSDDDIVPSSTTVPRNTVKSSTIHTTTIIEPMDDDEDEFIANFLLNDSEQAESNKKRRSSLHDRYVPSDDEFDLESGEEYPSTDHVQIPDNTDAISSSTQNKRSVLSQDNQYEERNQETSPLLGQKKILEMPGGGGGLFRRMLGSSSTSSSQSNDRLCSSALKQRKPEDDDDDGVGHSQSRHPHQYLSKMYKTIIIVLIVLTLVWLVTNRSVLLHWNKED